MTSTPPPPTPTTSPSEEAAAHPPLTFPTIAVINDKTSGMADTVVMSLARVLAQKLVTQFGPIWHTGAHLKVVPQGHTPPAGTWAIVLLDNSDTAGALGYHDLTPEGLPLGKAFLGTDRQYGQSESVTIDHELMEMLVDPWINLAAQADNGIFYAWECADAVESQEYELGGFKLSNFVGPAWFGHGHGPLDFLGKLTAPFQLAPGGYISSFDPSSGQGWQQQTAYAVQSAATPAERALTQYAAIPRVGSRRERRFRGPGSWLCSTYAVKDHA